MSSYKFNGLDIDVKKSNSAYELIDIYNTDFDRLVVSAAITCNKSDVIRYIVGYKTEEGRVIPLYVKSPENCYSNGVNQYNENSAWKMGLDISDDEKWMERYDLVERNRGAVRRRPRECLQNDAYINPKLIT